MGGYGVHHISFLLLVIPFCLVLGLLWGLWSLSSCSPSWAYSGSSGRVVSNHERAYLTSLLPPCARCRRYTRQPMTNHSHISFMHSRFPYIHTLTYLRRLPALPFDCSTT